MKLIANNIHKKIKGKTILNDISLEMETRKYIWILG